MFYQVGKTHNWHGLIRASTKQHLHITTGVVKLQSNKIMSYSAELKYVICAALFILVQSYGISIQVAYAHVQFSVSCLGNSVFYLYAESSQENAEIP